jgi:iron-sulfur cluster repair protein YtfE (RIC family)
MDALKLLKEDHRRIRALLDEGEETTDRARVTRTEIFEKLSLELRVHERREEEVLYPALRKHAEAKAIVLEGYEEHHVADSILGELAETEVTDERWAAKFKVLKESLEHHIEEEEGEMFSRARDAFDREELESMGDRMASITTPGPD